MQHANRSGGADVDVGVNRAAQHPQEPPQTDADERDADDSLAPRRQRVERQRAAQSQGEQADGEDAAGVTEAPQQASAPGPAAAAGERRHGGQVVRAGEHVDQAGREPGQRGGEHGALWHDRVHASGVPRPQPAVSDQR